MISLNQAIYKITKDKNFYKKFNLHYKDIEKFWEFREEVKKELGIDIIFNIDLIRITSYNPVYIIDIFDFDKKMKEKYPELNIA